MRGDESTERCGRMRRQENPSPPGAAAGTARALAPPKDRPRRPEPPRSFSFDETGQKRRPSRSLHRTGRPPRVWMAACERARPLAAQGCGYERIGERRNRLKRSFEHARKHRCVFFRSDQSRASAHYSAGRVARTVRVPVPGASPRRMQRSTSSDLEVSSRRSSRETSLPRAR